MEGLCGLLFVCVHVSVFLVYWVFCAPLLTYASNKYNIWRVQLSKYKTQQFNYNESAFVQIQRMVQHLKVISDFHFHFGVNGILIVIEAIF